MDYELTETYRLVGDTARRRHVFIPGDRPKARELLTEAIAMYRRIDMPKHVEMAEALLGQTGGVA